MNRPLIVAIDGPSGVGKSTTARTLARRLSIPYLDTGAMYRAIGLKVLRAGVPAEDRERVVQLAAEAVVELRLLDGGDTEQDVEFEIRLDGEPVGDLIRTPEVSEMTSKISTYGEIRQRMVELQRQCANRAGGVVEGRDIGTVVFPDSPHKFFLEAQPEVRLERRAEQLDRVGRSASRRELEIELGERDRRDQGRDLAPLSYDSSYTVIDTSDLTADQVIDRILSKIRGKSG